MEGYKYPIICCLSDGRGVYQSLQHFYTAQVAGQAQHCETGNMCIKLTRHFRCSATVEHKCEYLVRCSSPFVWSDDIEKGIKDQPCMEELDTGEEWYNEPCSDCTGEPPVPKTSPTRVVRLTQSKNEGEGVAVGAYAEQLAHWLFVSMHEVGTNPFFKDKGNEWADKALMERQMSILGEMICHVRPEHGGQWELGRKDGWDEGTQTTREGVLDLLEGYGCHCLSTQNPWLCNWALHIRRKIAAGLYYGLADPFQNKTTLDQAGLESLYEHQDSLLQRHVEFRKRILDHGLSVQGKHRMLEVLPTELADRVERTRLLLDDSQNLVELYKKEIEHVGSDENARRKSQARHESRASLMTWVRLILAYDSGLTIERARAILAYFAANVVKYDPGWKNYQPLPMEFGVCKRLAFMANKLYKRVPDWVNSTTGKFTGEGFPLDLTTKWEDWTRIERERASFMHRSIVEANEFEVDEMKESGDAVCGICLESFDDHVNAISNVPVQSRWCSYMGRSHWCGHACLMRFARTLQGDGSSVPGCPICGDEFVVDPLEDETITCWAALFGHQLRVSFTRRRPGVSRWLKSL